MQRWRWFRRVLPRMPLGSVSSPPARRKRILSPHRALNVHRVAFECLEERCLLAVELISRADPSLISDSAAGDSFTVPYPGSSVSANGRYVVFVSTAPNLVAGADIATGTQQVYRYDRFTDEMRLVSINVAGTGGGNASSYDPVISADGNVIAFQIQASDLHALDTNGIRDAFARDLSAGTTHLVSVNSAGTGSGSGDSFGAVVSANGRVVAFYSRASNLHTLDANSIFDVFARDLSNDTTHLVSINMAGTAGANAG
jgi:Tol biopolymer transport system component